MLTLLGNPHGPTCDGISRRSFLRIGAGGLLGSLAGSCLARAGSGRAFVRNKAVVFLWLAGGPPQHETFDPKPNLDTSMRTMIGLTPTSIPGVQFGEVFPRLARMAERLAVVRSFVPNAEHNVTHRILAVGGPNGPSMGAIYARLRGLNHERTGMPTFAAFGDQAGGEFANFRRWFKEGHQTGFLGPGYSPFDPLDPASDIMKNLTVSVPTERFQDRLSLIKQLDHLERRIEGQARLTGFDTQREQALSMLSGGVRQALDLSKEDPRTLAKYDTSAIRIGDYKDRKDPHGLPLGHHLLLARRLIEAGCGFVAVSNPNWDFHNNGPNVGVVEGMKQQGAGLDQAVAAFLDDLKERGLADKVLLVMTGEMGRDPKIVNGGRNHWGRLGPLVLAGGGLKMGQVIGGSDAKGGDPVTPPVQPKHLFGTIMHTLFDVAALRLEPDLPRNVAELIEQAPRIEELF